MTTQIYSRKRMARIGACLVFAVYGGIVISFFRDYPRHLNSSFGSNSALVIAGGVLILGCILPFLYAAVRVFKPTIVEGELARTDGDFVRREHNDLVICVKGRKYNFPLDSCVDTKLNAASAETIQVRMEVGAFDRPFHLELR